MCVGPLPTRMAVPICLHCEQFPQGHKPILPKYFNPVPLVAKKLNFQDN